MVFPHRLYSSCNSLILLSLSTCTSQKSLRSDSCSCKTVKGLSALTRERMLLIFWFNRSLDNSSCWIWLGIFSFFVINSVRTSFDLLFFSSWASLRFTTPWNAWLKFCPHLEHRQVLHLRQYQEKSELCWRHLLIVGEARASIKDVFDTKRLHRIGTSWRQALKPEDSKNRRLLYLSVSSSRCRKGPPCCKAFELLKWGSKIHFVQVEVQRDPQ